MAADAGTLHLLAVSAGLGLLGFVEPCTVGSSLLFVKYLEGRGMTSKVRATVVFALTRGAFLGALGGGAALVGAAALDLQRGFWVLLGLLYAGLGAVFLVGQQGLLMRTVGPALSRAGRDRGAAALGLLFGLNVPACAAPLLAAVLAATVGAGAALRGAAYLGIFGLALSLPLLGAVVSERGARWVDRLAGLSRRAPALTGLVFVGLGAWSVWWGLGTG